MKQLHLALLLAVLHTASFAQIVYVDKDATGANDGSSWANAYTSIADAVQAANNLPTIKEVRIIKNSTYTGNEYFIRRSYDISGGWDPATNSQVSGMANATILDGEHAHRIMNIITGVTVRLSGLHFTRGGNISSNGGGLHTEGNVAITGCFFTENKVIALPVPITFPTPGISYQTNDEIGNGGALCNRGTLVISNSYFHNNWAAKTAGAIANRGTITITGCTIQSNYGYLNGGAVFNYQLATMKVDKCRFSENNVDERVGFSSYFNGGGGAIDNLGANCIVLNSIFDKNTALGGGAINNWTKMTIRNCSFYANATHDKDVPALGGAILGNFTGAETHVLNSLFLDNYSKNGSTSSLHINGGSLRNCAFPAGTQSVLGPTDQRDNINSPPLWVDAANGDFRLQANSGVINKGSNEFSLPADEPGDFYGQLRISPCTIDIGAAEFQLVNANGLKPDNNGILYVDKASTYNTFGDKGSQWSKALPSLADAILYANTCESVREIYVAKGNYQEGTLAPQRGYMIKGSYDPATHIRDWKAYPTTIDLHPGNTSGRLMTAESVVDNRPITLDGLVFQNATQTALINNLNTELVIANCTFYRNTSGNAGGAVSNLGTIRLFNGVFARNHSRVSAGALANFGTCTLVNASFNDNSGPSQTSQVIDNNSLNATLKIQNSIITNPQGAFCIYNRGNLELNRNIIQGNINGTPLYVNGQSIDRIEDAPLFIDAANNDLRLNAGSPAINKGSNALYEAADGNTGNNSVGTGLDMARLTRVYDGTIDLGAYERQMKQQALAVADINATYGDAAVAPDTTSTTTLPVQYASADDQIAEPFTDTDNKQKIRIGNKGTVTVTASQSGDALYDPSPAVSFTVTVTPKPVAVTADNKNKLYGDADPTLSYTVAPALVAGDAFTGALSRVAGEDAGTYPIIQGSLANSNYVISFVPAQLVIGKAAQQITWNQTLLSACDGSTTIALTASSSSGLPVLYQSANAAVASVNNNQLSILKPGFSTITATQPGNNNYYAATAVSNSLVSRLPAHLLVKRWNDVLVFDNHSKEFNGWQWYRNGSPVNGATGQYYYESGQLNGEYYALATTTAGETLTTCPVNLVPGSATAPLTVFPNPTGPGQTVTVKNSFTAAQLQGATILVTNNTGSVVSTVSNVTPQTTLTMPLIQGLYVVRLKLASGVTHAVNVLVKP